MVEVWEMIDNIIPHFMMIAINYPCWLIYDTKRGPRRGLASERDNKHVSVTRHNSLDTVTTQCYEEWCGYVIFQCSARSIVLLRIGFNSIFSVLNILCLYCQFDDDCMMTMKYKYVDGNWEQTYPRKNEKFIYPNTLTHGE